MTTDIDALISTLRYWAEQSSTFLITSGDINRLLDALTTERAKVAALEAQLEAERALSDRLATALGEIDSRRPATCEMSLAHDMADIAAAALTAYRAAMESGE